MELPVVCFAQHFFFHTWCKPLLSCYSLTRALKKLVVSTLKVQTPFRIAIITVRDPDTTLYPPVLDFLGYWLKPEWCLPCSLCRGNTGPSFIDKEIHTQGQDQITPSPCSLFFLKNLSCCGSNMSHSCEIHIHFCFCLPIQSLAVLALLILSKYYNCFIFHI